MEQKIRDVRRYREARLSAERGPSLKKSAPLRACLIFPNTYHTGMSNLAVHSLYSILNLRKDCICERSFCEKPLTGRSLESGSLLENFHILAFSISFELDYPNVLRALHAAHIPLNSAERDESHPLIIAGGPCIFSNPEPLADCFDACVIGEGEEVINEIVEAFSIARERHLGRKATLRFLSEIQGVYIPSLYEPMYTESGELAGMKGGTGGDLPIAARVLDDLDNYPCSSVIVTPETEFSNMFLIELGRGCGRGCRFCSACYTYLRRNRSLDFIEKQIIAGKDLSKRIGLVTSDLADYPHRKQLLDFLLNKGLGFSVSSVRADAITDDLFAGMKASGQRTLTLAPEVATEKLVAYIGKRISHERLLQVIGSALEHDIFNFRLYYMIGFPGEEDEDVGAIVDVASRVHRVMQQAAKNRRRMGRLTLSVNPFVPKPFTPLESVAFEEMEALSGRIKMLRKGLGRIANTRLVVESPRMARLQCVFARGDRRVVRLAEMLAEGRTVSQALRSFGNSAERYLRDQSAGAGMRPWHTIQPPGKRRRKEIAGEDSN